jgi:hypothetical protein
MRYLYADSEPFPLSYPFLPTLEKFVAAASRALSAVGEIEAREARLAKGVAEAQQAVDALDRYVAQVSEAVMDESARAASPAVDGFARELQTHVERAAESLRAARELEVAQLRAATEAAIAAQRDEIRVATVELLLRGTPLSASRYRLRLIEGRYNWWATCAFAGRLEISLRLDPDEGSGWREPRRVESIAGELEVQVGLKKGWLKKDLAPVLLSLDDLVVGAGVLEQGRAEIHLRKKADANTGAVVLQLTREGSAVNVEIERPTDSGETATVHAAFEDVEKLERFWGALVTAGDAVLPFRAEIESATLDGQDVLDGDRVLQLIDLYVAEFSPIVSEIAKRSPSPRELSLKLEHDDGKREEIYLQKAELAGQLASLSDDMMQKLASLDIFPSVELEGG